MLSSAIQSCPTLCDSMDCSLSGSSVRGISQARVLGWAAISAGLVSLKHVFFFNGLFLFYFATPRSVWDLSASTRDWNCAVLITELPGKSLKCALFQEVGSSVFFFFFFCRYHWNPKALKIKRKTNSLLRDMLYMGKAESVIIEYVVFLEFSNLIFDLPPSSTHMILNRKGN